MRDNDVLGNSGYDAILAMAAVYVAVRLVQDNGIPEEMAIGMFHKSYRYYLMRIPENESVLDGGYWMYKDVCEEYGLVPTPPTDRMFEYPYRRIMLKTNVYEAYMAFLPDIDCREAEAPEEKRHPGKVETVFQEAGIYDYLSRHERRYRRKSPYEVAVIIRKRFEDAIPREFLFEIPETLPEDKFDKWGQ